MQILMAVDAIGFKTPTCRLTRLFKVARYKWKMKFRSKLCFTLIFFTLCICICVCVVMSFSMFIFLYLYLILCDDDLELDLVEMPKSGMRRTVYLYYYLCLYISIFVCMYLCDDDIDSWAWPCWGGEKHVGEEHFWLPTHRATRQLSSKFIK